VRTYDNNQVTEIQISESCNEE